MHRLFWLVGWVSLALFAGSPSTLPRLFADEAAERGYRFLLEQSLLPAIDFDQQVIDEVWRVWPEPLRQAAERAEPNERREMIFARYGLTPRPDDPTKPLQYVVDASGGWTMNCFACHGGLVNGKTYPGAPNNEYDLQTLTEETRLSKLRLAKPMARMDLGSVFIPLSGSRGTTNAVMFGVALMHFRDSELNVIDPGSPPPMMHHDMDAPPWWHFRLREHIYIDGFAARSHRALMQFALVRENGPEWFHRFESDFKDVSAYLSSVKPPVYPFEIDVEQAKKGEQVFQEHCARCHGTYGENGKYPEERIALSEVGTDATRLRALSSAGRKRYAESWFAGSDTQGTVLDPGGYVAPPLQGVWASAPYFHNGSVPTLWHVLHPEQRPAIWRKTTTDFDRERIGVVHEVVDKIPFTERDRSARRRYFETSQTGKSAKGHDFADVLEESQRAALLEYLKTL